MQLPDSAGTVKGNRRVSVRKTQQERFRASGSNDVRGFRVMSQGNGGTKGRGPKKGNFGQNFGTGSGCQETRGEISLKELPATSGKESCWRLEVGGGEWRRARGWGGKGPAGSFAGT